jgi:hypothetical protein
MTVVVLAAVTIISKKALDRATRAPRINPTRGTASPSRSNP